MWKHLVLLALTTVAVDTVAAEDVDLVVVGGGLTGIAAAREYASLRPDHTVVVRLAADMILEARSTLGGRVHSVDMFTVNGTEVVDIGAQWISPSHADLIQLVRSLGLTLETQTSCGERKVYVEEQKDRFKRSALDSAIPFDHVIRAAELQKFSGQSAKARNDLLNSQSEWIQTANLTDNEMHIVHRLLQTVLDAPESSVSALQLLLLASSESKPLGEVLAGNGHGEGMRIKEGLEELISKFSSGVDARVNEPVLSVVREDNGTVTVRSVKGMYSAKQVIIATPPSLAASIHFVPSLPHETGAFLQSYAPVGHAFYFAVTYNHPWWRANNISGETVYGCRAGPLTWMTTFDTGRASDCGSCGSSSGILWGIAHFSSPLPSGTRRELVQKALLKTMVFADAEEDIIDFKDYQFSHDEYLGGTIGILPRSTDLSYLLMINNTISHGPVHFASAELSRTSMGLMNGAVLSGKMAAHVADGASDVVEGSGEGPSPFSAARDALYDAAQAPTLSDLIMPATPSPSPSLGVTGFGQEASVAKEPTISDDTVVEESIDEPKIESPLRDQPVKSTTPFVYTTSTFYPPTTPPHQMESTKVMAWGPGDFDYKTSTQYPPTGASSAIDFAHDPSATVVAKDEEATTVSSHGDTLTPFVVPGFERRTNGSAVFDYHTSTQYPPTLTTGSVIAGTEGSDGTTAGQSGFNYSTSTHYPPVQGSSQGTVASSIDRGAEEEEEGPAKMAVLKNEQMVPMIPEDISGEIRTSSGAAFNYSTSTQYPPTSFAPAPTPLVHFSNGNVPAASLPVEKEPRHGEENKEEKTETDFSVDEPVEKAAKAEVTLRDHPVVPEGSGEDTVGGTVVVGGTIDHVAKAKSAMQTLEEEVPLLPKDEASGIGDRLLELLHTILKLLKGE
ncbi:amx-2 [Pristionchus pacificus]|uniref:Amine oxidase n=1 Tax=Pristionchus pacificus TaxID=54126 RepID=A0A2A6BMB4_PRIPA|nr:amx-2 [Pristionchus pacificus]|eukprot:PDM66911.1 amx-2 [Pristionchus pacificus]